jgi:hypothetical protein
VERRVGTKGSAGQLSTRWTQSRLSVSQALAGLATIGAASTANRGWQDLRGFAMFLTMAGAGVIATVLLWTAMPETKPGEYLD